VLPVHYLAMLLGSTQEQDANGRSCSGSCSWLARGRHRHILMYQYGTRWRMTNQKHA
jgi:hypothetical protein